MTEPVLAFRVFPSLYRDSVTLMSLASGIEKLDGVAQVGAVMATPANLDILSRSGMRPADLDAAPDDLVIVVRADSATAAEAGVEAGVTGLSAVDDGRTQNAEQPIATIDEALTETSADLVTVSTPGTYAPAVVERALQRGLHVFCFSDNVPVADERRLKEFAVSKGLLMMGPDCGTAVIDGNPLGFANVLPTGPVGIIAASGTGAQEVSSLLARAGIGVSQLIGVGGRDLTAEIGGLMTNLALDMLLEDSQTELIVVVSKPPHPDVAEQLLARLAACGKPAVACLLGESDQEEPFPVRGTLEGAAIAVAHLRGAEVPLPAVAVAAPELPLPRGVIGLYTGGTLAAESGAILASRGIGPEILDLGDDEYTQGRPHPMIDPAARARLLTTMVDRPDIGIVLADCVLGHGSAADPAAPLAEAAREAIAGAKDAGRGLVVLASVTGTAADPQGLANQIAVLEAAGVHVFPSNAAAARAAAEISLGGAA